MALLELTPDLQDEFLAFWDELEEVGEDAPAWLNWGDDRGRQDLANPEVFRAFTHDLHRMSVMPDNELPDGRVRATTFFLVDNGRILGRINVRHDLTPHLLEIGGHIGYIVRPSERNKGYATQMLRGVLPYVAELGIGSALVTCDTTNEGSRRVIEGAGGVLEDIRHDKRRYWVSASI